MARQTFVKAARKDIVVDGQVVVKKGQSYYWFKPMVCGRHGAKQVSLTPFSRQQLTGSDFRRAVYDIEDYISANNNAEADPESVIEEAVSQIQDLQSETQDKLDNMPEGLREGNSGQMLQERIDALDSWISSLQSVDVDVSIERSDYESDEEYESAVAERRSEIESEIDGVGSYEGD